MIITARRAAGFCLLLLLALLGNATWVQAYKADDYDHMAGNRRPQIVRYQEARGDILVAGKPITGSQRTSASSDLAYARSYTDGPLYAPITGYASQLYGTSLIEGVEDDILAGTDARLGAWPVITAVTRARNPGGNVATTILPAAQRAAFAGLASTGNKGAVAAIDPVTGAVLALVSTPSYDPGVLAGVNKAARSAWSALDTDPDRPMLNRALRETYPPGSTFKVVTAAAALTSGTVTDPDAPTTSPDPYLLPDTRTPLGNGSSGCRDASLRYALTASCNTVFAKLGVDMGADTVRRQADAFGFDDATLRIPVAVTASVFPKDPDRPQTALSSIGQFDTRATPLQMAMVAAGIANDGEVMRPYLVDKLTRSDGTTVETTDHRTMGRAVTPPVARQLQKMMQDVVTTGTAGNARIDGAVVGGKTGTAQHGERNRAVPYAWFIAYAKPADDDRPAVAVAVVVEDGAADRADITGGGLAAPIAKAVMTAVLAR
ncbi:penicillin-binding transpeptidase domain-containing protein [Embleya sp. NBC_00896]|uniref:penicillin-binding transpeptidase domain-containing protein n=1 Tax=Embleya sp. NBC_00896 TaxID=2975961 RepID=UPI00386641AA|nr:penicillin-binding transpeptidase domain-containing protein [Embleya sp. NBC_00896]